MGVFALLIALAPSTYGQAVGSFSGTVTDKSGSSISGATVRAISEATGISREVKTDEVGHYLIPLLPAADYTVHVESAEIGRASCRERV